MNLKAVMLLLEQQILQGTKRVRVRGGKSRGRAGDWVSPSLCCPAFWLQTPASRNPSLPGGYEGVLDSVLA